MFGPARHLELPRRITAYYLLFGMAAIAWLTVGAVFVSQSLQSMRAESTALTQLGKISAALTSEYGHNGEAALQPLVERIAAQSNLTYCEIVGNDGCYLAHSNPLLVGKPAVERSGAVTRWGEVQGIRFVDEDAHVLQEYQSPLKRGDKTIGTLHVARIDPTVWGTMWSMAEQAPGAILGPMLLVALGALVLRKTVRPLANIETQLEGVASAGSLQDVPLEPVAGQSPVGIGWNRLVQELESKVTQTGLETRLGAALEGFRNRQNDQVFNSIPDGVAVTDAEGRITFANHALIALLGQTAGGQTLRGKTMEAYLALDDAGLEDHPLVKPDLKARTTVAEIDREQNGAPLVLRVARHPFRGSNGAAAGGHVWTMRDVTQQKLADQMRTQFVSAATHELRTPLSNIKAYAETLALSELLDVERQKEFCNTINSEATRLGRFIDDLLSINSMEAGALSLARQETDIERMFRETVERAKPIMAQKQIEFLTQLPEKLPKLALDKDKMVATFVNLLGNAAKYTPNGGRVTLRVEVRDRNLEIAVEDTGIGIAAEELPKVFEKFFRSADPRVKEITGSGLGLALAHEVVRLHGGQLTVQSELNKGSTFTVILPV